MSLIQELKRRNVIRVGIAYLVGAWVLLQFADFVLDAISAPNWILQVFILAAAIGLPVALIFSWVFEMTPDGIRRESQIDRSRSVAPATGRKLDRVIITFMAAAILILVTDRLLGPEEQKAPGLAVEPVTEPSAVDPSADKPAENSTADPHSIAVLPFVNMSSDLEQEYFSDGITEEILNRLAGVRGLQVAARTSAFSFKGDNRDVREIAQLLGVGNILEGSVRKAGDQVRITAQLIRASDGFHLWSEAYDRKLENIFAIQDDIASEIADALEISLSISSQPARPGSPDWSTRKSTTCICAPAHCTVSAEPACCRRSICSGRPWPSTRILHPPGRACRTATSWCPITSRGTTGSRTLATCSGKVWPRLNGPWNWTPICPPRCMRWVITCCSGSNGPKPRSITCAPWQLDPDSADIMEDYASLLVNSWQLDAAFRVAERMVELDPQVPIFLFTLGIVNHASGEFEERDRNVQAALDINPNLGNLQFFKLSDILQYGQLDQARDYARQMNPETLNVDDLLELIDWVSHPGQEPPPGALAAMQFGAVPALVAGRYDIWLDLVNRFGAEWPEWKMTETISLLAPIASPELMHQYRADPRTKVFLTRLRLPEYWRKVGWPEVCRPLGEDDFECF